MSTSSGVTQEADTRPLGDRTPYIGLFSADSDMFGIVVGTEVVRTFTRATLRAWVAAFERTRLSQELK